jgi:hypothetical protein
MPETLPGFQRTQYAFAAHIRDPARHPAPADVRPERMATYRELFVNNVESFIANGFPVLRAILDDDRWRELVHDFFARHRCLTPYFMGIPEEFLAYLQNERSGHPEDFPFLLELAHYEWVELALSVDTGSAPEWHQSLAGNELNLPIILSEVAWPLAYRYPVHRIGPNFLPQEPPSEPTFLAVYRDRDDLVHFMELNPVSYRLLELIGEDGGKRGSHYLDRIAQELGAPPRSLDHHGGEVLAELTARGIVGGQCAISEAQR